MKKAPLLAFLIFLLAGCSGFQHAHYRKLNKVEASGLVSAPSDSAFQTVIHKRNSIAEKAKSADKNIIAETETESRNPVFEKENKADSIAFPLARNQFEQKKAGSSKPVFPKAKPKAHLGGFISALMLLASVFFIFLGLWFLIFGIWTGVLPFVILGAFCFLAGGYPVWLALRNMILKKRNRGRYESQR